VEWQVSPEVGSIDGTGTVSTGEAAARGSVTARVSGVTGTAQVEVTEATPRPLDDFEGTSVWAVVVSPPETVGAVTVAEGTARSGKHALKLEYDFTGGTGTRTVSAVTKRTLRQPLALKLWAYGDGQGVSLRVRILDGKKEAHLLDLAPKVDWKGSWHELRAPISEDLPGPVTLDAILVSETDSARKPRGAIFIDDLSVEQ
jgi:hypothetical protein